MLFRLPRYCRIKMTTTETMQSEFVPVPMDFKAAVIGTRGSVIEDIRQRSGAQVWSANREDEGFTVSGNAEQIAYAKKLILEKVVSKRIMFSSSTAVIPS